MVDLWGGVRNKATGAPWEEDTMVIVFSTTKGMAGLAVALAHSRGLLDYEEPVCTYWPEFAQAGKERITVRQLLSHQAGCLRWMPRWTATWFATLGTAGSPASLQQIPAWEPGTRQAYHAISLGFYESELLRRVDPQHRSLGQFFQDEIAAPLGLDFYIRLPEEIPDSRLATIQRFNPLAGCIIDEALPVKLAMMDRRSLIFTGPCLSHPGLGLPFDPERVYSRNLEVPSQGGVGTAASDCAPYSVVRDWRPRAWLARGNLAGADGAG